LAVCFCEALIKSICLPMQKPFTPRKFQNNPANQKVRRGIDACRPSKSTVDFIMAYAAALTVFKTKLGNTNVLLN